MATQALIQRSPLLVFLYGISFYCAVARQAFLNYADFH